MNRTALALLLIFSPWIVTFPILGCQEWRASGRSALWLPLYVVGGGIAYAVALIVEAAGLEDEEER